MFKCVLVNLIDFNLKSIRFITPTPKRLRRVHANATAIISNRTA